MSDHTQEGVVVLDEGKVRLTECEVRDNRTGIAVGGCGSNARLRACKLVCNGACGLNVADKGEADVVGCTITDNGRVTASEADQVATSTGGCVTIEESDGDFSGHA